MQFREWLVLNESFSDGEALLRALLQQHTDNSIVLIFSDWLEERGHSGVAEFLRLKAGHYQNDESGFNTYEAQQRARQELSAQGIHVTEEYVEGPVRDRKGNERTIVATITHRDIWLLRGRAWVKPPKNLDFTPLVPGLAFLFIYGTRAGRTYDRQMNWKFLRRYMSELSSASGQFWNLYHRHQLPPATSIGNVQKLLEDMAHLLQQYRPSAEEVGWLVHEINELEAYLEQIGQHHEMSYRASLQDRQGGASLPKMRTRLRDLEEIVRRLPAENTQSPLP